MKIFFAIILLICLYPIPNKAGDLKECIYDVTLLVSNLSQLILDCATPPVNWLTIVRDIRNIAENLGSCIQDCDHAFCLDKAQKRCEYDNPSLGCEQWGAVIYPKCKQNYYNVACCICSHYCPEGYRDDGLYCAKPGAYGRGAGYPWLPGDKAFSLDGARERCLHDNPVLGCEQYGWIIYPKCKEGYHNFGCCVCTPSCPDGWEDIGVSCKKPDDYGRGMGYPWKEGDCLNSSSHLNNFGLKNDSNPASELECSTLLNQTHDYAQNMINQYNTDKLSLLDNVVKIAKFLPAIDVKCGNSTILTESTKFEILEFVSEIRKNNLLEKLRQSIH